MTINWLQRWLDEWHKIEWGEKVIVWLIGAEIVLSLAAIGLTIYEAKSQDGLLGSIVTEQQTVDSELKDVNNRLGDLDRSMVQMTAEITQSANTSNKMNAVLQSQLDILAAEQKQRLADLAKKPEIYAEVGGVRLGTDFQNVAPKTSSATSSVFEVVIHNVGTLSLTGGLVRVSVDDANIILTVPDSIPLQMPTNLAKGAAAVLVPIGRLNRGTWVLLTVTVSFPNVAYPFQISLTIDGDNYPLTPLGGILVTPPRRPVHSNLLVPKP